MSDNFNAPEFLEKIKARDSKAITTLVNKYNKQIYNAAIGQGLKDDQAEEVTQSTWSAFFEGLDRFEGRSHIRTYLFGIMYNKVKELWRYNGKFVDTEDQVALDAVLDAQFNEHGRWATPPIETEKFVWATEALGFIEKCMEDLTHNQRTAFYLKEVEGEDSTTICKILGISRTNFGVILYRAKNLLRKCLEAKSIREEDI